MHGGGGEAATSITKIFGNIFISFVGAGVLGLPYAFKEAGVLEGCVIMTFICVFSIKAMMLLIDCKYRCIEKLDKDNMSMTAPLLGGSEKSKKKNLRRSSQSIEDITISYGKVGTMAFGNTGGWVVDVAIVVSQIGFCCAYIIFISQNLSHYLANCFGEDLENITTAEDPVKAVEENDCEIDAQKYSTWVVVGTTIPLIMLGQIRHLNKLAIFSLMADFANLFAYLIVFWFDFEHITKVKIHPKEMNLEGFPFFLSVSMYCYEGAGLILSLEESVHKDQRKNFKKIFYMAMSAITFLYIVFGVSGYLSFGPETESIITLNLPAGVFPGLVKASLCFSLFFTFPIMMFPVIETLERRLKIQKSHRFSGSLVRAIAPIVTSLIVLLIPSFSAMMGLIGATCCSLLAFILPALFHQKLFQGVNTQAQTSLNYFLIFLGIVGCMLGTHDALVRIGMVHSDRAIIEH